ncbi:MAG: GDP-mannose 4,6-dehydratase [Magnetococcales bacterium]|nr:GDP-mannose 4,6-dehydratase [Magnetococcales bacterium]
MRALVVGCKGQDGSYLMEQLRASGVEAHGVARDGWHRADGTLAPVPVIGELLAVLQPERIFHLAAFHHSSEDVLLNDAAILRASIDVHLLGLLDYLEAMPRECRLFYAASSHVFGIPRHSPQDETTPMEPVCPYGITKAAGVQLCRLYRERHQRFCSAGFLYNHESPRRRGHFLSRKVAQAAVAIARGEARELVLGNLDAWVDWGYAPEYVDAMIRILNLDQPGDFVIASGVLSSVRDFVAAVFAQVGLDWRDHVRLDPAVLTKPARGGRLVGDAARLRRLTGWHPVTDLTRLAALLVEAEWRAGPS